MSRAIPRALFVALSLTLAAGAADKPTVLDVWPGKPPGQTEAAGEEKDTTRPKDGLIAGKRVVRLGNVSKPTLTVYRPAKDKDTGAAVVVCPGGAYRILAWDLEGTEVCDWLVKNGVTAVLLKYRVPALRPRGEGPLMDAQRALSLVRSKAKDWGIDPKRVGQLGFSAGGHLTAATATAAKRAYEAIDDVDKLDCKPNFCVLVYPGYLTNDKKDGLAKDVKVTKQAPPMFLVHAKDDQVPAANSEQMAKALKAAGVAAELHLHDKGGHGFGLRKTERPVTRWPERCAKWMKKSGFLDKDR
jgi:acetyl esterase/lipase